MNTLPYPKSFPNKAEEQFLRLVLSHDTDFPRLWKDWNNENVFNDTDYATARLMPLLYLRLEKLGLQNDPLFGRIKGIYRSAWVTNQRLLASIRTITSACEERNIPVMVTKGIPMLLAVHQDIGARYTGDADIVIHPIHAQEVISLMKEHGWKYTKPWMPDVNNPVPSLYQVTKSTDFVNQQGVAFDVHWNIFGLYHHARPLDIFRLRTNIPSISFRDTYWKTTVPLGSDIHAMRLSNEDMFIHAIVHGVEGNVHRTLRWVTDAVAIMRNLPIHWDVVIQKTREFGFGVEIGVALRYLSDRINIEIPNEILQEILSLPYTKRQAREFNRRANLTGGERFSPLNNILMFWYAYWIYEPTTKHKTIFGFFRYAGKSLGMHRPGMFSFIIHKYVRKTWRRLTGRPIANIIYEHKGH